MQDATVRVPICPCKCQSRKKIRNAGKVNDIVSTVARNMSLEAGIRERRKGGKNATEDLCEAFSAKNHLLSVQKEVSELRLVIQMMEGKMDSLLDNINRMSKDGLPSPVINRDVASTVDFSATAVDDERVLVHGSTKTDNLISKLTSDMALNTAEILALKKVIRKKQIQTEPRSNVAATPTERTPAANDVHIYERILLLETKVHSLAKKSRELKTERKELNTEEVKNIETKISSLRELMETFTDFQSKEAQKSECRARDAEISAREAVRLKSIEDDCRNVSQEQFLAETNKISKKVNVVSTNISKACRSLSIGLNDVQKVAVDLIDWSDEVHIAFAIISEKLFLSKNLCPRLDPSLRRATLPLDNFSA